MRLSRDFSNVADVIRQSRAKLSHSCMSSTLAARIDSDIRAEIRENEETLQMIGPMRAIDALSKSTAVSSLANASMNVLGNVMSLARTVRTTAATHAAPMEGAVNVGRREDAGFAGGSDDGGGGGREKDSSTFAVGGAFDGSAKPSQPASGHHRLSGLSEVTEEAEDEAERDIELETEAGQRALERGDGDATELLRRGMEAQNNRPAAVRARRALLAVAEEDFHWWKKPLANDAEDDDSVPEVPGDNYLK